MVGKRDRVAPGMEELVPEFCREISHTAPDGEIHRADIKTPTGIYIEVQHSRMTDVERTSREAFYRNLVWVIDGKPFQQNFDIYHEIHRSSRYRRIAPNLHAALSHLRGLLRRPDEYILLGFLRGRSIRIRWRNLLVVLSRASGRQRAHRLPRIESRFLFHRRAALTERGRQLARRLHRIEPRALFQHLATRASGRQCGHRLRCIEPSFGFQRLRSLRRRRTCLYRAAAKQLGPEPMSTSLLTTPHRPGRTKTKNRGARRQSDTPKE